MVAAGLSAEKVTTMLALQAGAVLAAMAPVYFLSL